MDLRVLFDDPNSGTPGCTVDGMNSVDQVLVTRVTDDGTTANVTQTFRQLCSGGVLGGPIDVNTSGWPVGFQTSNGHMLVETAVPFTAFGSNDMPSPMRIGFSGTRGSDSFAVLAKPNGNAIIFPLGPQGRRRSAAHPGPDRVIVLDGLDHDWAGIPPSAQGAGGGASDIKLIHALTFANPNDFFLYFNFSINTGGIEAVNDFYQRTQGDTILTEPAPGVLGNDISNGVPLTAIPVSTPDHGTVTLNQDGSFVYQPTDPNSLETDTFEYKATHQNDESNVATVTISVGVVEQAPAFTSANHVDLQAGVPANFIVTTSGVPPPAINYSGTLPTGVTFTDNGDGTATIGGTPVNGSGGTYSLVLTAINAAGIANQNFTITVCNNIVVTNPVTTTGTAGAAFSQNFTQSGAVGTATFTLNSGALPAGLSLATNGTLSGTPTVTGSFPITVRVTDSNGCIGIGPTYTLVIGCQTITVTNPGVTTGTAGAPFSQTFTQTGAIGTATFTTSSTLPAGLTLSTAGVLSGTPTQTGIVPDRGHGHRRNGCTGTSATYTLVIGCQTITVNNPATTTGTAGRGIQPDLHADRRHRQRHVHPRSGTLPAGLSLATNGALSGTPTQIGIVPDHRARSPTRNGCTGTSATYNLTINCQTITVTNPACDERHRRHRVQPDLHADRRHRRRHVHLIGRHAADRLDALHRPASSRARRRRPAPSPSRSRSTDGNGCTGTSATYTLVIDCQTITVTNPGVTTGTAGTPFSETFTQTGAIGTRDVHDGQHAAGGPDVGHERRALGHADADRHVPDRRHRDRAQRLHRHGRDVQPGHRLPDHHRHQPGQRERHGSSPFSETFTQTGAIGTATFTHVTARCRPA